MTAVVGIDHVQIGVPTGGEAECRRYYVDVLGLPEMERPESVKGRSFLWVRAGAQQIHFRPEPAFAPAQFAHPALLVDDIDDLAAHLAAAGFEVNREQTVGPGRFHTRDPFGNRLEFIQSKA
jgi:catechol 2,3-dioxygenase-like lactoylglutathione lyase family enzyme